MYMLPTRPTIIRMRVGQRLAATRTHIRMNLWKSEQSDDNQTTKGTKYSKET
jgi:hypothetical protein